MTILPMERDNGVETPRGRAVLEYDAPQGIIEIRVNGVCFGTLDPETLKARAQMDLEKVQGAYDLLRWCETHAGVAGEQRAELERQLGEMPLRAIFELAQSIAQAMAQILRVPKLRK